MRSICEESRVILKGHPNFHDSYFLLSERPTLGSKGIVQIQINLSDGFSPHHGGNYGAIELFPF